MHLKNVSINTVKFSVQPLFVVSLFIATVNTRLNSQRRRSGGGGGGYGGGDGGGSGDGKERQQLRRSSRCQVQVTLLNGDC